MIREGSEQIPANGSEQQETAFERRIRGIQKATAETGKPSLGIEVNRVESIFVVNTCTKTPWIIIDTHEIEDTKNNNKII